MNLAAPFLLISRYFYIKRIIITHTQKKPVVHYSIEFTYLVIFPQLKSTLLAGPWWCTPLILALGAEADLCDSEASLIYRGSSRTARAIQRIPVSKTKNKTKNSNNNNKNPF